MRTLKPSRRWPFLRRIIAGVGSSSMRATWPSSITTPSSTTSGRRASPAAVSRPSLGKRTTRSMRCGPSKRGGSTIPCSAAVDGVEHELARHVETAQRLVVGHDAPARQRRAGVGADRCDAVDALEPLADLDLATRQRVEVGVEDLDLDVGGRAADAFGDAHAHRRGELGAERQRPRRPPRFALRLAAAPPGSSSTTRTSER